MKQRSRRHPNTLEGLHAAIADAESLLVGADAYEERSQMGDARAAARAAGDAYTEAAHIAERMSMSFGRHAREAHRSRQAVDLLRKAEAAYRRGRSAKAASARRLWHNWYLYARRMNERESYLRARRREDKRESSSREVRR